MKWPILTVTIRYENDVVTARQRARQIAALLGFEAQDQSRIATAVSEIARNAFMYAGGGNVMYQVEHQSRPQALVIEIRDEGPGIVELENILRGAYNSSTGMGLGIIGARRLMDECEIESGLGSGTRIRLKKAFLKWMPHLTAARLGEITSQLAAERSQNPLEEIQLQNHELLRLLDELRRRQDELERLNRELEDTNRGVIALYSELDERAVHLRHADQTKSRFLSHMSHEFRTPLNSIVALAHLLLARTDGELAAEQEKQIVFIRKSAYGLLEMVNDLLDLSKIEAGKVEVRAVEFTATTLFSALRGVFRPLITDASVDLIFEDAGDIPPLLTDEGKVTQILRNFISNALKFTERGEVRVRAAADGAGRNVIFSVADTGIGIASGDQARIFEEFSQVENSIQQRVRGTGLGLPVCRRLAMLLGGEVSVESEPGKGSTFSTVIPMRYEETGKIPQAAVPVESTPAASGVLVVEDDESARYLLRKMLDELSWPVDETDNGEEGIRRAREAQPRLILLDLNMPGIDGRETLNRLRGDALTSAIPVVIVTSQALNGKERAALLSSANAILSKEDLTPRVLQDMIERFAPEL